MRNYRIESLDPRDDSLINIDSVKAALEEKGQSIDNVIDVDVPDDHIIKRMAGRRV